MEEVTTRQAAKMLGVSKSSIDQYCRKKMLPHRMVGPVRLIPKRAVERFKRPDGKPGPKPAKKGRKK